MNKGQELMKTYCDIDQLHVHHKNCCFSINKGQSLMTAYGDTDHLKIVFNLRKTFWF